MLSACHLIACLGVCEANFNKCKTMCSKLSVQLLGAQARGQKYLKKYKKIAVVMC